MLTRKRVFIVLALLVLAAAVFIGLYRYFPANFLFAGFPKEETLSFTVECDTQKVYHVGDAVPVKAVLTDKSGRTYMIEHNGSFAHFELRHEDDLDEEIAYPMPLVSQVIWAGFHTVKEQSVTPEKAGRHELKVTASFSVSHGEAKKDYHFEKTLSVTAE